MTRHTDAPTPPKKRPYRAPTLTVHGDLKAITQAKAGRFTDGSGKPNTRLSGSQS